MVVGALVTSLIMNPRFLITYSDYGKTLGVGESLLTKALQYPNFYKKLYYQVSGTYYTPPVTIGLMLLGLSYLVSTILIVTKRGRSTPFRSLLIASLFMHIGFIIIGRYGQPSVILFFPYGYLILILLINRIQSQRWMRCALVGVLTLILATSSFTEVRQVIDSHSDYNEYIDHIAEVIDVDAYVLGNLNAEYALQAGHLYDWRNLEPAYRSGLSFEEYIHDHGIAYIIYPDEIDLIYQKRPLLNGIYGNISLMYEEIQEFITTACIEVASGTSPTYAMRIVRYQEDEDWGYRIFQVR